MQADFGSAQCGTKVCFLFIGSRFALADTLASGRLPPIVYMPEGGGSAPPLGLEVVGVIDLARWLAVAGIRACCGAATV